MYSLVLNYLMMQKPVLTPINHRYQMVLNHKTMIMHKKGSYQWENSLYSIVHKNEMSVRCFAKLKTPCKC